MCSFFNLGIIYDRIKATINLFKWTSLNFKKKSKTKTHQKNKTSNAIIIIVSDIDEKKSLNNVDYNDGHSDEFVHLRLFRA